MTLAELQSTVAYAVQKAEEAKIPLHKVDVKVDLGGNTLDLFPGPIKFGEQSILLMEAE